MNPHGIATPIPRGMHQALRAYTFRVTTAAAAYYADEAVRSGLCARCRTRQPSTPTARECKPCRDERKP